MAEPDIALLIGVPTEFDVFCQSVGRSDWLSKYDRSDLEGESWRAEMLRLWTEEYRPDVVDPICQLEDFARENSFEVRNNATISDLQVCSELYQLIVVFAHWKGSEVEPHDLTEPNHPDLFLARVREGHSHASAWLAPRLEALIQQSNSQYRVGIVKRIGNALLGRRQFESVHELLSAYISLPPEKHDSRDMTIIREAEITRNARRRAELDELLAPLLRPGNRIELHDGLRTKEEISGAISRQFRGTLDLTTCTSTILGDYLGGITEQRFRIIQYPTVQQFAWCAECVQIALELVIQTGMTYSAARLKARSILTEALLQVFSGSKKRGM